MLMNYYHFNFLSVKKLSKPETLDLTPSLALTALISLQGEDRVPQSACVLFTKQQP